MTELNPTQQQKQYKILLIGDNCTDVYQYGTVDRISPEAPVPVFKFAHEESRPGMAGNVYNNLVALGCNVYAVYGETSTKTRLIDTRSKQQIVRIDNDVYSDPIDVDYNDLYLYDAIVISDYNKGSVSYELVENLRKQFTGPIFVDTKKTDVHRFEGCYVKINSLEYSRLTSFCSNLIVTEGDQGASLSGHTYPAPAVEVSDVCGAGDTFLAALTYGYLCTNSIENAIEFANRAASITVQHLGVYAPTLKDME
jgi:D-beta-D-heptose 7-phosphate kinase/D-beta-D-heptose 1-phosphate adenosyltransferase